MKIIINENYFVRTKTLTNNSNYTKSVVLYNVSKPKEFICGTILHEKSTKEQIIQWGLDKIESLNKPTESEKSLLGL